MRWVTDTIDIGFNSTMSVTYCERTGRSPLKFLGMPGSIYTGKCWVSSYRNQETLLTVGPKLNGRQVVSCTYQNQLVALFVLLAMAAKWLRTHTAQVITVVRKTRTIAFKWESMDILNLTKNRSYLWISPTKTLIKSPVISPNTSYL